MKFTRKNKANLLFSCLKDELNFWERKEGRGGGDFAYEGVEMLVGNFELNP